MMKRRIFPWMGLIVLFLIIGFGRETLAQEIYKVKRGDTLAQIAKKYAVSPEALREANHLQGSNIRSNQVLTIPNGAKRVTAKKSHPTPASAYYTVRKGDSIFSIAKKTGVSVSAIREVNNLSRNSLKAGQKIKLAKAVPVPVKKGKSTELADLDDDEEGLDDDLLDSPLLTEAEKNIAAREELMGKWNDPQERRLFVKVATAFLGAPYRWGGVSLRGLDCSAFVKKIYQLFDISLPRTAREQAQVGVNVAKEDLVEGDLVFFNTRRSFGHVGIYIGNSKFVHASSGGDRVVKIDSLDAPYYNKRFAAAVRLKGLDEEVL